MTRFIHVYEFRLAIAGCAALAVGIGIGRFAFTPLLPMMQADFALALTEGGLIASANYSGYLIGALCAAIRRLDSHTLFRAGLLIVVSSTCVMSATESLAFWLGIRFLAGLASAWVLVGATALIIPRLREAGHPALTGIAFSGVGLGIIIAGLTCQSVLVARGSSDTAWLVLTGIGVFLSVCAWRLVRVDRMTGGQPVQSVASTVPSPGCWRPVIIGYGLFGYGYILPATSLPAQARDVMADPASFGLVWPLFGLATVLSTVGLGVLTQARPPRQVWITAQLIMAVGLVRFAIDRSTFGLLACAVCVGGTFMVITMAGMREGEALGGSRAKQLISLMTAAFALGQLSGPLILNLLIESGRSVSFSFYTAALALVAASVLLGSGTGAEFHLRRHANDDPS